MTGDYELSPKTALLRRTEAWLARLTRSGRDTLPDFLVIGAQKAGTTWLDENLRRHPEIFLPPRKELHYFDGDLGRPLRHYRAAFRGGEDRIKGDVTPAYAILPAPRVELIRRVLPDVRIVFLLRDPVERSWSQAVMEVLQRTSRTLEDVDEAELIAFLDSAPCISRSDYLGTLERWERVFPPERLHVGIFEDIRTNPRDLLTGVLRHLGASVPEDWADYPLESVVIPRDAASGTDGVFERTLMDAPGAQRRKREIPQAIREHLGAQQADALSRLRSRLGDRIAAWGGI